MDILLKNKLVKWGWLDHMGRSLEWFNWNKPDRTFEAPKFNVQGTESGRSRSERPNYSKGPRSLNEKRNYGKDDKEVSSHDRRPSSQSIRTSNRGSRPTGQRTDPRRGSTSSR
jgi:hypothetical protein